MSTEPCQKCKHWEKISDTGWAQSQCNLLGFVEPEDSNDVPCKNFESRKIEV